MGNNRSVEVVTQGKLKDPLQNASGFATSAMRVKVLVLDDAVQRTLVVGDYKAGATLCIAANEYYSPIEFVEQTVSRVA